MAFLNSNKYLKGDFTMENNGIINGGNGQNGAAVKPEKKGVAKLIETVRRKYDEVRYSRAGKIVAKVVTVAGLVGVGKTCYDKGREKGKTEVVPTVVYIEKDSSGEATEPETNVEQPAAVEETTV